MTVRTIDSEGENDVDPRPLLSISFVNGDPKAAIPGVLETAPGAQHRYEVVKHEQDGFDRTDLTLLWVPMVPNPLSWIGVVNARESARADGKVLIVFTKTKGFSASEIDEVECQIRERLTELGGNADNYATVHEQRRPGKKDGTVGSSTVIDALNSFARVENTGFDDSILTEPDWFWRAKPVGRTTNQTSIRVMLGTIRAGDVLRSSMTRGDGPFETYVVDGTYRYTSDPSRIGTGRLEKVEMLRRFDRGVITFSNGNVPRNGAKLVSENVSMGATVKLRLSWPWSPERRFKKQTPRKGDLMPTYVPGQARPLPANVISATADGEGSLAVVSWKVKVPILEGAWMIVDHGTPRVFRAELLEIVDEPGTTT